jgi:hypothetical protein
LWESGVLDKNAIIKVIDKNDKTALISTEQY